MAEQRPEVADTHFDIALDDEPAPSRAPVYVDVVAKSDDRRPILPAYLRSRANFQAKARYEAGRVGHITGYHAARALPLYLPLALFWSVVGVFRLIGRQVRWASHPDLSHLMHVAANKDDLDKGAKYAADVARARKARFLGLAAEMFTLAIAVTALLKLAPVWAQVLTGVLAVPWLAHIGRPQTMPIVSPAVVTPRFRKLTADVVLRAYYAAKLGHPDKPGQQITFASTMQRDTRETGSQVLIDMPFGTTFSEVMSAKEKIASGLDVHINQVSLTPDKSSSRRHMLYVADRDPLAIPAGRTDLLNGKPRNIWRPMRLGKDERDGLVTLLLMWASVLIGAQPRKGKTFTARLIALFAALDPWVRLYVVDGKNSPDWRKFSLVAHRMVIGTHPSPSDPDPIDSLMQMLDEILSDIEAVNQELSRLPVELCPEGKLTEQLARDPRFPNLRVRVLVMEEFQVYFETEDQKVNQRISSKLSRIQAVGPSAGVIVVSSSQKPSGVGAGDVARLFNRYRDNHQVRFALKCGNDVVSRAVLGGDAYDEGFDASKLPVGDEYRGVGYLYGASDRTPTVRTFFADHGDAERILLAARRHREAAGTLSGYAAGEDVAREVRDVLADARRVFYAGEARISWPELAERMAQEMPEHYADLTPDAISTQLRALGVAGKSVKDRKHFESGVGQGFDLEVLEAAIQRRQLER